MNGESQLYQGVKGDFLSSSLFWSLGAEKKKELTRKPEESWSVLLGLNLTRKVSQTKV